ncbi:MAG TPA: chemotaxis protein CheW [Gemmatimonadales bacterium]|jgi:chemotaxis signal transduction protein|nr:chemotaxis protein CheW [Gemmatimonadales bacterium]
MSTSAVLLARAGQRRVALPLEHLVEVIEPGPAVPVPAREPALRGLATLRGRLIPLVHLGALLDGRGCPAAVSDAGVVIAVAGRALCLEVEAVEEVTHGDVVPVPAGEALPWALGVVRAPDGLVPILDVLAVGSRLLEGGSAA